VRWCFGQRAFLASAAAENIVRGLTLYEAKRAGTALGLTLLPVEIRTLEDLEGAFSTMMRERADEHGEVSASRGRPDVMVRRPKRRD
jgi:hypothetical protein